MRQIAHRSREHVAARRPRQQVSRAEQSAVVERFLAAIRDGDLQGLLDVLAPDVVVVADGGGVVSAARARSSGADKVAAFLGGPGPADRATSRRRPSGSTAAPAARVDLGGELNTVMSLVIEDGRITRIYAVRNPHKMARLDAETALSR